MKIIEHAEKKRIHGDDGFFFKTSRKIKLHRTFGLRIRTELTQKKGTYTFLLDYKFLITFFKYYPVLFIIFSFIKTFF